MHCLKFGKYVEQWGNRLGLVVIATIALAACGSSEAQPCSSDEHCPTGYQCAATGGVLFGESVCLLAAQEPSDTSLDAGDAARDSSDARDVPADVDADVSVAPTDAEDADSSDGHAPETGIPDTDSPDADVCTGVCGPDADDDGVLDADDNCPGTANADQSDLDADGSGDACDSDIDGDGQPNAQDNCPARRNPQQTDRDSDSVGDACDPQLSVSHSDAVAEGLSTVDSPQVYGWRVVGGADVTGDGVPDPIISGHVLFSYNGSTSYFSILYIIDGSTQPPGDIDLTNVWATVFMGGSTNSSISPAIATPGDVNGDGIADLLIGSTEADGGGSAYLVYGGPATSGSLTMPGDADVVFSGSISDGQIGSAVDISGDLDGDGTNDLVIAEAGFDNGRGRVFVVKGSAPLPATVELPADADMTLTGDVGDAAGVSVSAGGDLDGDGIDDLLVGAASNANLSRSPGGVYLVRGTSSALPTTGRLADVGAWLQPVTSGAESCGASVAHVGDVDGDGVGDFLAGAPTAMDMSGQVRSGAAYLVLSSTGLPPGGTQATLDSLGVRFEGSQQDAAIGVSVAGAGDLDGDGFDDMLVGGWRYDVSAEDAGQVFVFYGASQWTQQVGAAVGVDTAEVSFVGGAAGDRLGFSVAGAGDLDGDGFPELLMSAPGYDANSQKAGAVFLFSRL